MFLTVWKVNGVRRELWLSTQHLLTSMESSAAGGRKVDYTAAHTHTLAHSPMSTTLMVMIKYNHDRGIQNIDIMKIIYFSL